MHYVYLICRERGVEWYVGCATDLRLRLREHNGGETKPELKFDLIYYEAYLHKLDAIRRECFLKSVAGRDFLKRHLMWFLRAKQPKTYPMEQVTPLKVVPDLVPALETSA